MGKTLRKLFCLGAMMFGSTLLSACGPQYADKDVYDGEFSFDDGVNHVELKEMSSDSHFTCTVELTVNDDQYYFYDVEEIPRLCHEDSGMEYQCTVYDPDLKTEYFPKKRNRTLIFHSRKGISFDPNNAHWNFSFRYQTSRYVFHFYPRPR